MNAKFSKSRLVIAVFAVCKLITILYLPIVEDEAYYAMWFEFPALGYLDHPPMVAWLGMSKFLVSGAFGLRLASMAISILGIIVFNDLCHMMFPQSADGDKKSFIALLLFAFSSAGCAFGCLLTPDTPQFFFWILVLHEIIAFQKNPHLLRLLTAGISLGLGFMSKYTLVLLLPVLILASLQKKSKLTIGALGAIFLSAFICIAPHFFWNASHDWLSFRFVLNRGLAKTYNASQLETSALPVPVPITGSATKIADYFNDPTMLPEPPKPEMPMWRKSINRTGEFVGSMASMWGFFVLPLLFGVAFGRDSFKAQGTQSEWTIVAFSTWIPLLFFGLICLFTKVEGNWIAPFVIGASLLAPHKLRLNTATIIVAGILNILLLGLVIAHVYTPVLPIKPRKDRLLRETTGYPELAGLIQSVHPQLLLFDTFQTGSLIHFYAPAMKIAQWPGMTRVSEFQRQTTFTQNAGQLTPEVFLLTYDTIPPQLPGYDVTAISEIRNCARIPLQSVAAPSDATYLPPCPAAQTLRRWFLVRYTTLGG